MLSYVDETHMLRKFNVKVRSLPRAKTNDMLHYLAPLLGKNPDYVILHVGTNNAVDHQSNDIISKIFKLKDYPVKGTQLQGYNFNTNKKT